MSLEERLILEVEMRRCLYDVTNTGYMNQMEKNNAWAEISAIVGIPVDLCRSKWKNLRDTYRRLKREKTRSGDAGGVKPSKWPFLEQLQFLNATLDIPREIYDTSSNITLEMLEEAMDSPAVIREVESFQQTEGEDGSGSSVASSSAFQGAPPCASGKKRKGYDYKLEVLKELRSTRPEPAKQHTQSELFFMSLAIEMNGLTEKKRRKVQAAIMNMLADIDDDN